jgi:hypothetical protein
MHGILAQPAAGNHRTYRNITPSMVPGEASTTLLTPSALSLRQEPLLGLVLLQQIAEGFFD